MRLGELLMGTDVSFGARSPEAVAAELSREIVCIASDSRRVRPGCLFICQRGLHHDGHRYIDTALENGAVCVIGEESVGEKVLTTSSARITESVVWNNFYKRPTDGMKKIAVTGTAGKTTVAFTLRHILRSVGHRVGVLTTLGAFAEDERITLGENGGSSVSDISGAMTTPDPEYFFGAAARMKVCGCDTLIYEASSQSLLLRRTDAIVPDIAIFTNLSPEHLDCHGDMESYFLAKARLMETARLGITNADDRYMSRLGGMFPEKTILTCSCEPSRISETDVCAIRIASRGALGMEYVYFSRDAVFRVQTPLIGRHSVCNTMQAVTCALCLGADPMLVKDAVAVMNGVDGRLCRVDIPRELDYPADVFIDYAHTPESLAAALSALSELRRGRLLVLFGCGGDRDREKRPRMAEVAQSLAELVVVTGDNPRTEDPLDIIADIVRGLDTSRPHAVIPDRREAIRYIVREAREGDIVLLAGKGHERYEIDADGRHPFDEEALVLEAVEEMKRNIQK